MYAYLRLIRLHHLVLIAALQCFIRYFLLIPLLAAADVVPVLSDQYFYLLVASCFFLAAAGYIINDYFDLKTDYINRPEQVLIGKNISRRVAMAMHLGLTFIGIVLMAFVAYKIQLTFLVIIGLMVSGLLWYYSTTYKHQFVVGNFVIALLAFLVVMMVPLFEPEFFKLLYSDNKEVGQVIGMVIGFYAIVVFLMAFVHTLVKDMEDMEGDSKVASNTIPLVVGIHSSRWIVMCILLLIMIIVGYVQSIQLASETNIHFFYLLITIQLPLLLAGYFTYMGEQAEDFKIVKMLLNVVMYTGAISILVFRFLDAG